MIRPGGSSLVSGIKALIKDPSIRRNGETWVKWSGRIKCGEGCKRGVRERIWGGTTNHKRHSRGHRETCHCRSFFKYM